MDDHERPLGELMPLERQAQVIDTWRLGCGRGVPNPSAMQTSGLGLVHDLLDESAGHVEWLIRGLPFESSAIDVY